MVSKKQVLDLAIGLSLKLTTILHTVPVCGWSHYPGIGNVCHTQRGRHEKPAGGG